MATDFWDARGIIHVDYLQKDKTINGEYISNLLGQFNVKKKKTITIKKTTAFDQEESSFSQDNARVHTCAVSMSKIQELGYELLPHPPYSLDLVLSDHFLFPNLKKWLGGKRFESNDKIISQINAYFDDFEKSYFWKG